MIRVLLADDQTLIRQGLRTLLELEPDIEVVGQAATGREALEAAARARPDVVLMDVRMPEMDGVAATRELARRAPDVAVVVLTTFDDDEYVFEALRAGARGYLLKDVSSEEIAAAVRTVAAGGALIQPSIARRVFAEFGRLSGGASQPSQAEEPAAPARGRPDQGALPQLLTERELEVLGELARGLSNREIADKLYLTEGTVKNHVSNVLGKLEVRDRTQAVLKAQALRLL